MLPSVPTTARNASPGVAPICVHPPEGGSSAHPELGPVVLHLSGTTASPRRVRRERLSGGGCRGGPRVGRGPRRRVGKWRHTNVEATGDNLQGLITRTGQNGGRLLRRISSLGHGCETLQGHQSEVVLLFPAFAGEPSQFFYHLRIKVSCTKHVFGHEAPEAGRS